MAKIKAGAYPEIITWQDWITFNVGPAINRIFLYRLAAYIKAEIGSKTIIGWGLRSIARQAIAYQNYLNGGTLAAKPGASWHNYGLAVDVNKLSTGRYPGTLNADYDLFSAGKPETLHKYGLTHTVTGEPWHIQPIETRGWAGDRFSFSDLDDWVNTPTGYPLLQLTEPVRMQGAAVKELQRLLNLKANGTLPLTGLFGEQTEDSLQKVQAAEGLTVDGQAGSQTWHTLTETVAAPETDTVAVLQDELDVAKENIVTLNGQVAGAQGEIARLIRILEAVAAARDVLDQVQDKFGK